MRVKLVDGKARSIQHMMATSFWHADGTPMSAQQFMRCHRRCPIFFVMSICAAGSGAQDPETRRKLLDGLGRKALVVEQLADAARDRREKSDLV